MSELGLMAAHFLTLEIQPVGSKQSSCTYHEVFSSQHISAGMSTPQQKGYLSLSKRLAMAT